MTDGDLGQHIGDPKRDCANGVVLAEANRIDEAIEAYRQALQLDPRLAEGHNNLANALRQKGAIDEAANVE